MKTNWKLLGWLLLGLTLLASRHPAHAAEVSLTDDRGRKIVLAQPPQRIISLLPSLTEAVCALGGCAQLVGVDRYSSWPASVQALPRLGGMEDAQIERIVALRPDVVLAARSSRAVERLEALGLKVAVLEARTFIEVHQMLERVAVLLGRPQAAAPVWQQIEAQLQQAVARVPAGLRGQKVYFEVDAAPYAAGSGSFIGETLARLGLGNIVPPELGPFPKLNPEYIVKAQPAIIIGVERNVAAMPGRPGWNTLTALQQRRTCAFPSERYDILVRPGPRLGEAALVLADCLAGLGSPGGGR